MSTRRMYLEWGSRPSRPTFRVGNIRLKIAKITFSEHPLDLTKGPMSIFVVFLNKGCARWSLSGFSRFRPPTDWPVSYNLK